MLQRALGNRTAGAAQHEARGPAAVHEEHDLLAPLETFGDAVDERRTEDTPVPALEFGRHVDQERLGEFLIAGSSCQAQVRDGARQRLRVDLERRCGASEDDHAAATPHALARDVHGVVTRNPVLLVAALVRLVDRDQAEIG
jgi:hypothetical protein